MSKNIKLIHPRNQITEVISRIYKRGMTTTSGGNISIIDDNGDIWVTPSAIDKGSLRASDIICVKKDGTIIGKHKPSSEFPFHKAIYEARPDIRSVIHAHPPALVSFSIVRQIPNTNVISQAKHICGPIGYAKYRLPGSEDLGDVIADEFKKGYKAIIMENHGTVLGGSDLTDAYERFEALEFCARTILYGTQIGTPNYLTDEQIEAFESQAKGVLPEMESVEYSSEELEKRLEICNIVKRSCQQGLMISSYGTVSMRLKEGDFLITPTDINRWDIDLDDIVQIKNGQREAGKTPSRAAWIHQEIYNRNPDVNSIIMTQSPYLMAFGITGKHLNVRTIPESWIFLQDINLAEYGTHFRTHNNSEIVDNCSTALIIKNDSVIITGDKLLQTFDYLEVAEFSAKSIVLGHGLGEMVPINDEQVEDLRQKFLT
ncbi:class II aldolase/adducin family protein [Jejuia pallidilutea]|jgi:L-fuculose-phosphate aldolase|uniref:Ribulose-5-phosphate 4-epimerase and related epimerases and aldolases n=1 Tax=Jejuia pallidilutea TaxID=504487 RepID=A0A090VQN9_9FLAO|nr:class II aldolase/adducin family protein [Jejuia pallidilutea]GAL65644.1 ribulose-5-phosphate 4-epimerase and related epimerases and aldolases [Jejuia pallidilutea]GAL72699.1 ribulose-5-phosphate 4-epimerase and related epimerases and aldolases [Jejuia pallidilutea]GAL88675.1 ribulose-5-phosphate 4-epimerase and related epimerases and aldolases [Jejuia pallidilutea]